MSKIFTYLKRNGLNIAFWSMLALLVFHPGAKSWLLSKVLSTGLLNADLSLTEAIDQNEASFPENFQFRDAQGELHRLSEVKGKVIFMNFWASWCPPCRAEYPSIAALHERFKDHPDMVFILISEDEQLSQGLAYLKQSGFDMPIYQAQTGLPEHLYAGSLPTSLIWDKQGKLRFKKERLADYHNAHFIETLQELLAQ